VRLIVILVLAAAVIAFIAGNTKQTSIRVIVPVVTMPLWLALVGTAAISLLVGWLLARRKLASHRSPWSRPRSRPAAGPRAPRGSGLHRARGR
jgi:uncharacterized integral membrane protein